MNFLNELKKQGNDVLTTADIGTGASQVAAGDHTHTIVISHTWAISGEVKVASGSTDFIPSMFVSVPTGQTVKLIKSRYKIRGGTSATVKLTKNGTDITGFTNISATTTAATTDPTDVTLADNDEIALVVTAVSGTPDGLSFTIFLEITI